MAIDDQEEARDALEAVLSANGAFVRLGASGKEAIERLEHTRGLQSTRRRGCRSGLQRKCVERGGLVSMRFSIF
ncbi:hypothetical protein [Paraburkholderia fynbosensis]|uniref:hypothetical protein n=1 Tax=Paraburkholderia fynbosensis TaxID=1200993 RepID=UPI001581BE29|nr:hypothetical protein [Paraburkholderia fynbosensis]